MIGARFLPLLSFMTCFAQKVEETDVLCAEIWDLFPNSTEESVPNRDGYFISITHPYLNAVKGYVPRHDYNLQISSHDLRGFYEYTVAVFSAKFPGQFLGTLRGGNNGQ